MVIFIPTWGKISILTNIFQVGWNHQLEKVTPPKNLQPTIHLAFGGNSESNFPRRELSRRATLIAEKIRSHAPRKNKKGDVVSAMAFFKTLFSSFNFKWNSESLPLQGNDHISPDKNGMGLSRWWFSELPKVGFGGICIHSLKAYHFSSPAFPWGFVWQLVAVVDTLR